MLMIIIDKLMIIKNLMDTDCIHIDTIIKDNYIVYKAIDD